MPQLDTFTYVNLSFFFFFSFLTFYSLITYCVFPAFNLVQKVRYFFNLSLGSFSLSKSIFEYAIYLNNGNFFDHGTKRKLLKFNFRAFYIGISPTILDFFFVAYKPVYFSFPAIVIQNFVICDV
jgi:hypothetical protein